MAKVKLRVPVTGETPTVPVDADFDMRDKLSELAIRGNMLAPDDKMAIMGYLSSQLGKEKAEKLMTHAYIFNSRPEVQRLSPEDKLRSFYTIGSTDPDIKAVIDKSKSLGYGVVPGFRESVSTLNQAIQKGETTTPVTSVNPEVQRRIRLKINK